MADARTEINVLRQRSHDQQNAILRLDGQVTLGFASLNERTGRIETILWSVAGGTILQLLGLCGFLASKAL